MFIWHPTASVAPTRRAFDDQIWQLGCVSFVKSTSIMRIVRHGPSPVVGFYEYAPFLLFQAWDVGGCDERCAA